MAEKIDIGHGVLISFYEYKGVRAGLIEEHPSTKSETGRCSGSVAFRVTCWECDGAGSWQRCESVGPGGLRCEKPARPVHGYHIATGAGWPEPRATPPTKGEL